MQKIKNLKFIVSSVFLFGIIFFGFQVNVNAATLNVEAGTDELDANSFCSLSEAIYNINNGNDTTYPECSNTGDAYGTNDTINLPEGTIVLSANLDTITQPVKIVGQGMRQSVIDGAGQYTGLQIVLSGGDVTLNKFTFKAFFGYAGLINHAENVYVSELEIDGVNAEADQNQGVMLGLGMNFDTPYSNSVYVSDLYIHDIDAVANLVLQSFNVGTSGQSQLNAVVERVTMANIKSIGTVQGGVFGFTGSTPNGNYSPNIRVSNFTAFNLESTSGFVVALASSNIGHTQAVPVLDARNVTIHTMRAAENLPLNLPTLGVVSGGYLQGDEASAIMNLTNAVVANVSGSLVNCGVADISAVFSGQGTGVGELNSGGGNMSDNNDCVPYFSNSADKNNAVNLVDTIANPTDNGGKIPTMALLENSPAVDGGVAVAGLNEDARGAFRPQGAAFDSGAYESAFSKYSVSLASTGRSVVLVVTAAVLLITAPATYLVRQKRHK